MENLNIASTFHTPQISFNYQTGILELNGSSTHTNSYQFYEPLLKWLDKYAETPQPKTVLNFQLDYFNTGSSMYIVSILKKMEKLVSDGNTVEIKWFYDKNDDGMLQNGEELNMLLKAPMEMVEIELSE